MRRAAFLLHGLPTLCACALATQARAQSLPQTVVARGLYEQALAALDRRDHHAACPMLEEAIRLEPAALGAKLTLAACYEGAGRLASAWGLYGMVEHEAALAKQEDRRAKAHDRVVALEGRLAYIVVDVPDAVARLPGLAIKRDGVGVGPGQWGVPLPADKGTHVIETEAAGRTRVVQKHEILADGVTARAVIIEPPRAGATVPWWRLPTPPPAPPVARQDVAPLVAPPPSLPTGILRVDLATPEGLSLQRAGSGEAVCRAPCGKTVDARRGEFFLAGEGFLASDRFRLDGRRGSVTITASPATRAQRIGGITAIVVGAGALGCGLALPFVAGSERTIPSAICLSGGLLTAVAGIVMLARNRTTYTIAWGDAGVFRF